MTSEGITSHELACFYVFHEFMYRVLLYGLLLYRQPHHVKSGRQNFTALLTILCFFLSAFFPPVMFSEPLWAKGYINVPSLYCQAHPITCPQLPGFLSLRTPLVIARPPYSPGKRE